MSRIRPGAVWALAIALSLTIFALCFAEPAAAEDVHLSWSPVTTDNTGKVLPTGTSVTYNVYGAKQGQPLAVLANITATSNVRSNVDPGTACYSVTALVAPATALQAPESLQVPTVCTTIAAPPPVKPAAPAAPTNFQLQQAPTPTALFQPLGHRVRRYA